ncbi:hypothetical protein [Nocardia sp. NPDC051463]|uniref:hypothetical protein n=1 Tax=Nocardia sp. NPDC051463 TaxID=3154845 RepID=UPI003437B763
MKPVTRLGYPDLANPTQRDVSPSEKRTGILIHGAAGIGKSALVDAAATCTSSTEDQRFGTDLVIDIKPVDGGCQFRMSTTGTDMSLWAQAGIGFNSAQRCPGETARDTISYSFTYPPHDGPWYRFTPSATISAW